MVCVCSPALMYGFSSEHFWRLQGVELAKVPRSNPHPGFGDRLARFPMWCPAVTPLQVTAESQKVKRPPSTAELKGLLIQLNESEFPRSQEETPHISGRGPAAGFLSVGTSSFSRDGFWDDCPPGRVMGAGGTCPPATPARSGAALLVPEGGIRAWGQVVKNPETSL